MQTQYAAAVEAVAMTAVAEGVLHWVVEIRYFIPGGVTQPMKVTLATSTATIPMEGMPILYACFDVNPA